LREPDDPPADVSEALAERGRRIPERAVQAENASCPDISTIARRAAAID
jgi:hypothetical protein